MADGTKDVLEHFFQAIDENNDREMSFEEHSQCIGEEFSID